MPHFYFHLVSPRELSPDEIGVEFPDVEAAYLAACQAALDIGMEMLRARQDPSAHRFEITGHNGALLFEVPFSEMLQPAPRPAAQNDLIASLRREREETQRIRQELRAEVAQARSLLRSTHELVTGLRF